MDAKLLADARQAQERLITAERDAEVARAEFNCAVRRLHLHGASLRELAGCLGLSHQRVHQIVEAAGGSRRWARRDRDRHPNPLLVCTFCGRHQTQVKKLIAGPSVYICNKCIELTRGVVESGEPASTPVGQVTSVPEQQQKASVPCSFCGKRRHQVTGLAQSTVQTERKAPATICTECLDLCDEIVAEEGPLP